MYVSSCTCIAILQEMFPLGSPNGEPSSQDEAIAGIPPSVSAEYLYPKEEILAPADEESIGEIEPYYKRFSEFDRVTYQKAIGNHPLLPSMSSISQEQTGSADKVLNTSEEAFDSFKSKPDSHIDVFVAKATTLARQLTENKHNIDDLMQSIDNESSYFINEMSMFCRNLLEPYPVPGSASSEQVESCSLPSQPAEQKKIAKGNRPKVKSRVKKKRVNLSRRNTEILQEWLVEHVDHPFPKDSEKDMLCLRTGLGLSKLNTWFVNARRRLLGPFGLRNLRKEIVELKNEKS